MQPDWINLSSYILGFGSGMLTMGGLLWAVKKYIP